MCWDLGSCILPKWEGNYWKTYWNKAVSQCCSAYSNFYTAFQVYFLPTSPHFPLVFSAPLLVLLYNTSPQIPLVFFAPLLILLNNTFQSRKAWCCEWKVFVASNSWVFSHLYHNYLMERAILSYQIKYRLTGFHREYLYLEIFANLIAIKRLGQIPWSLTKRKRFCLTFPEYCFCVLLSVKFVFNCYYN